MHLLILLILISQAAAQLRQTTNPWPIEAYKSLGILAQSEKLRIEEYFRRDNPRMHVIRHYYRYQLFDDNDTILGTINLRSGRSPEAKFLIDPQGRVEGNLSHGLSIFASPEYKNFQVEILRLNQKKLRNFRINDIHWRPSSLVCFGSFIPGDRWNESRGFPFISTIEIDAKGIRNHRLIWTTWHEHAQPGKKPDAYQHRAHRQLRGTLHADGDQLSWMRSGLAYRDTDEFEHLNLSWMTTNLNTGETKPLAGSEALKTPQLKTLTKLQIPQLKKEIENSRSSSHTKQLKVQLLSIQNLIKQNQ